jgi:hypothetical protein
MRVVHDRKCRKLKRLDERGADFNKVDSTRTFIRDLSTKISMAINVVDKISMTINKIRDEELWPQLKGLIQGYVNLTTSNLVCTNSLKFLYFQWSVLYNGTTYLILLFIFGKWLIYAPYVQNFD